MNRMMLRKNRTQTGVHEFRYGLFAQDLHFKKIRIRVAEWKLQDKLSRMADEPKKRGRPQTKPDQKIMDALIEHVSEGNTIRAFCEEEGMPSFKTIYNWRSKDEEFATRLARAREIGADAISEEVLKIADTEPEFAEQWSETGGSKRRDAAFIQWKKLQIETRLNLLKVWFPQKFGAHISDSPKDAQPITINVVKPDGAE